MAVTARKYNPGFLTDDELVASFCVRTTEFEMSIETLRDCTGPSNPHQIVIGPRGSGKTSLLLRIAAEVRRDARLAADFFPVVFAEESYEVATAGEFWLECLSHLVVQAPRREDDPDLHRTFEELRTIGDDRELADRCIGTLLDFSDRVGKRLVLMVENLDMMFRDMADPDAGWRLRTVLQTEPRIILFASAISRFDEIDNPKYALYEQFSVRTLRPLDTDECAMLWKAVAGRRPPRKTIRSLEILTGGSPRLLTIVARFGAELSFQKLMANLLDLVDDHTEYFKSHLESLAAQERRVYLALAVLWKPATTREIADHARIDTSQCSAQLTRLVKRGVVRSAGGSARRKQYYLTERLYNIYYLLRRSRRSDRLVEALIHFMEAYYSPSELKDIGTNIIREAKNFGTEMLWLPQTALTRLMELPALAGYREELQTMVAEGSGESYGWRSMFADTSRTAEADIKPDGHGSENRLHQSTDEEEAQAAKKIFDKAAALDKQNQMEAALTAYSEVIRQFGESKNSDVLTWLGLSLKSMTFIFMKLSRRDDMIAACDELIVRLGESEISIHREWIMHALFLKGLMFQGRRPADALAIYDEIERRFGDSEIPAITENIARVLVMKSDALQQLNRMEDVLTTCDEVDRRFGDSEVPVIAESVSKSLAMKSFALRWLNRMEDALAACDEVDRRFGDSEDPTIVYDVARVLSIKPDVLRQLNRMEDALVACDEIDCRFGDSEIPMVNESVAKSLVMKPFVLQRLNRMEDALVACDEMDHRFGDSEVPMIIESVAESLSIKSLVLQQLNRMEDALAACDEVVSRFGDDENAKIAYQVTQAMARKGILLVVMDRLDDARTVLNEGAAKTAERTLDLLGTGQPELRIRVYLIRAAAILGGGDPAGCQRDVETALALLPEIGFLPNEILKSLMFLTVALGLEPMCELIKASPSADLLLPLTTALELELGLELRVAQEVREVAEDIRQELVQLRESGTVGADGKRAENPPAGDSESQDG